MDEFILLSRYNEWHFGIDHPERLICVPIGTPFIYLIGILAIVIVVQVVVFGFLLWRRSRYSRKKKVV